MIYLGNTPLAGTLKQKLFESSGTFTVPADVYVLWLDACSGGGGGGGGFVGETGGGGGGGGPAMGVRGATMPVTPGEIITLTIGAGGVGGAAGASGGSGGTTAIAPPTGAESRGFVLRSGAGGAPGTETTGGASGGGTAGGTAALG